jgi:Tfp pilus assembly protein PilO
MKIGNMNGLPWYLRFGIFAAIALAIYGGFCASQRLSEFRTAYKNKQEELAELNALLPEQRELTKVLQGIQDRARATGLSLRKFSPKDDVQQDFYSGKKIDASDQSSFNGLRAFFDQMAHYQRIVSITNFEVKQLDKQALSKTIEARFDLTAYYVSSEKLQKAAANQPGQPAANPAAATQQAVQQQAAPQLVTPAKN